MPCDKCQCKTSEPKEDSTVRDLTEIKFLKKEISELTKRFDHLYNAVNAYIWETDRLCSPNKFDIITWYVKHLDREQSKKTLALFKQRAAELGFELIEKYNVASDRWNK